MNKIVSDTIYSKLKTNLMSFDNDASFSKEQLPKDANKRIVDKVLYDFDNCQLGDILKYNDIFGFNLLKGKRVGQCCCTADQMIDGKSRFWATKPDIKTTFSLSNFINTDVSYIVKDLNFDTHKYAKLKNSFYGYKQYKEKNIKNFIENIDGIYNTSQLLKLHDDKIYTIVNELNDNEYIPEYYEIATACKNLVLYPDILKNLKPGSYWTSTFYYGTKDDVENGTIEHVNPVHMIHPDCLSPNPERNPHMGGIGGGSFYDEHLLRKFINIPNYHNN